MLASLLEDDEIAEPAGGGVQLADLAKGNQGIFDELLSPFDVPLVRQMLPDDLLRERRATAVARRREQLRRLRLRGDRCSAVVELAQPDTFDLQRLRA